jgi:hypothetical protein
MKHQYFIKQQLSILVLCFICLLSCDDIGEKINKLKENQPSPQEESVSPEIVVKQLIRKMNGKLASQKPYNAGVTIQILKDHFSDAYSGAS